MAGGGGVYAGTGGPAGGLETQLASKASARTAARGVIFTSVLRRLRISPWHKQLSVGQSSLAQAWRAWGLSPSLLPGSPALRPAARPADAAARDPLAARWGHARDASSLTLTHGTEPHGR